jgi:hypothetical protein
MNNSYKKFSEVRNGDKLYCLKYGDVTDVVELTAKDVQFDPENPDVAVRISIVEKVPNTIDKEGEYVIEDFMRGDECYSENFGVYTTKQEALMAAINDNSCECDSVSNGIREAVDKIRRLSLQNGLLKTKLEAC